MSCEAIHKQSFETMNKVSCETVSDDSSELQKDPCDVINKDKKNAVKDHSGIGANKKINSAASKNTRAAEIEISSGFQSKPLEGLSNEDLCEDTNTLSCRGLNDQSSGEIDGHLESKMSDTLICNSSSEATLILPTPSLLDPLCSNIAHKNKTPRKFLKERGYYDGTFEDRSFPDINKKAFPLYERMLTLIQNNVATDCVLQVGQYKFNCHQIVLQAFSRAFDDLPFVNKIHFSKDFVDPKSFVMIYKWMTSECPLITREGVIRMFGTAHYLKMEPLLNHLWSCIDGNGLISEEHALNLYFEARNYKLFCVQKEMLSRVQSSFLSFVSSKEFVELTLNELCELLNNNTISVNSEIEVFMSVIRWFLHKPDQRLQMIKPVMKKVRFGLMHPHYLTLLKKGECHERLAPIYNHPYVQQLANEGLRYSIMQLYYFKNRILYRKWIMEENITEIPTRKWIYDRGCLYHHKAFCKYPYDLSYWTFLDYLEELRVIGLEHHYMLEKYTDDAYDEKQEYCCRD